MTYLSVGRTNINIYDFNERDLFALVVLHFYHCGDSGRNNSVLWCAP
ncbi:unnamed protein product, partial [Amoebophrya sp. A25]|eukprot:GSA25T00011820001.1